MKKMKPMTKMNSSHHCGFLENWECYFLFRSGLLSWLRCFLILLSFHSKVDFFRHYWAELLLSESNMRPILCFKNEYYWVTNSDVRTHLPEKLATMETKLYFF